MMDKASRYRYLDREAELHKLAWIEQQAGASKKNGKPVFRTFKRFFDYNEAERQIMGETTAKPKLLNNKLVNYLKRKG